MRAALRAARDTAGFLFGSGLLCRRRSGERLNHMQQWLGQNAGADGWAMTPSSTHGVLNDAISIHLADATIASALVARWYQKKLAALDLVYRRRSAKGGLSRRWCA
jgi:hypothetical protein